MNEEHKLYKSWTNKNYFFQSLEEITQTIKNEDQSGGSLSTGFDIFNFADYLDDGLDYWVINKKMYFVIPVSIIAFNYGSWDKNEYKYALVSEHQFMRAFKAFLKRKTDYIKRCGHNCGVGYIDWELTKDIHYIQQIRSFDDDKEDIVYLPILKYLDIQMEHG